MAIPSRQIGWGTEENLLWQISKQLERLTCVTAGGCGTTTTTTTIIPFADVIGWSEGGTDACNMSITFSVIGSGTTFCNSSYFTAPEFSTIGNGTIIIAFGGQYRQVNVQLGSNVATSNNSCDNCPPALYSADYAFNNAVDACTAPTFTGDVYSIDNPLVTGSPLFYDANLSNPVDDGHYLINGNVYSVINHNVETNEGPCPTSNLSLTVTNSSSYFNIETGANFTIEWNVFLGDDTNHPRMYSFGSYFTGGASHAVSIENGILYWWVNGSIIISTPVSVLNAWHHFCIMRNLGYVQIYIDGVSIAGNLYMDSIPTAGKPLYIGSEGDDSLASALFSNFRWNNTEAVYTPGGFTPPSAPLNNPPGTSLLLFQGDSELLELTDNSGLNQTITNGTGLYTPDNPFLPTYEGSIAFGF